jgi:hypothetical protein
VLDLLILGNQLLDKSYLVFLEQLLVALQFFNLTFKDFQN